MHDYPSEQDISLPGSGKEALKMCTERVREITGMLHRVADPLQREGLAIELGEIEVELASLAHANFAEQQATDLAFKLYERTTDLLFEVQICPKHE